MASATVEYQFTNAPEYDTWATSSVGKTVSAGSASNLPAVTFMQVTAPSDQGAYGRFRITSPNNVSLQLQVVVAGYSD
ncbi:MAG: hypothetical protein JNK72_00665 [Myxococcales bacterium]|nr:hypothetical protein [Myxococcales bacterium]